MTEENKKKIKDYRITQEEIFKLSCSTAIDISMHSLSMWLKCKTDNRWVVVPRDFCMNVIEFLERIETPNLDSLVSECLEICRISSKELSLWEIKRYL